MEDSFTSLGAASKGVVAELELRTQRKQTFLADGIYFNLEADKYHADPALGSGDIRRLARNPYSYYWGSSMNPMRPKDKDTPARIRGRAMHEFVLESEAMFKGNYMRGPYSDGDELTPAEKSALTKEAKKKAEQQGKTLLKADEYDRIVISSNTIMLNPSLSTVFKNGYGEVSVFWTREEGVRCKARLDYLKAGGIGDLKSIVNPLDLPFDEACLVAFKRGRFDVQAKHYFDGHGQMVRLLREGKVFGPGQPAHSWLYEAASNPDIGFQFVFFAAEGAPLTFSRSLRPKNDLIAKIAAETVNIAIFNYLKYMKEFGTDKAWLLVEPVTEITTSDFRFGYEVTW